MTRPEGLRTYQFGDRVSADGLPGFTSRGVEYLLTRPIPDIPRTQLDGMDRARMREAMHIRPVRLFNPQTMLAKLRNMSGSIALGFDLDPHDIQAELFRVRDNGTLFTLVQDKPLESKNGVGYVDYIKNVFGRIFRTAQIQDEPLSVGFSFSGPTDGTKPTGFSNLQAMKDPINGEYEGDLAKLVRGERYKNQGGGASQVDGDNNAIAGLVAAAIEAVKDNPTINKIIYYEAGGGIGSAYIKEGKLYRVEQGHLQAVAELNPFNSKVPCGLEVSDNTQAPCLERAGGSGVGIEEIFHRETGKSYSGKKIAELYEDGDPLAISLYDNAALIAATSILGLDKASANEGDQVLDPRYTVVVCGGGTFKVNGLGERMEKILDKHLGYKPKVMYTKKFGQDGPERDKHYNPCTVGAAMLALTTPERIAA